MAVGPFNYEVVVGGTFTSRIDFKNLTLAQLALLGLALREKDPGPAARPHGALGANLEGGAGVF